MKIDSMTKELKALYDCDETLERTINEFLVHLENLRKTEVLPSVVRDLSNVLRELCKVRVVVLSEVEDIKSEIA